VTPVLFLVVLATSGALAGAQQLLEFQTPPREILELVDVEMPPQVMVDPANRVVATLARPVFKSLAELAEDELRLAGVRINPAAFNRSRTRYHTGVGLLEIASGKAIPVVGLPSPVRVEYVEFSPRGRFMALAEVAQDGLALWVVDLADGTARRLTGPVLNAVLDRPCQWLPDESGLLCRFRSQGAASPALRRLPAGPTVQEAVGRPAPGRTYQDLLASAADAARFEFYTTASVVRVGLDGSAAEILPPAIYRSVRVAPGGAYLLVETVGRPFSYQFPYDRFPYRVHVATLSGASVAVLADKPLQDSIPIAFGATEAGPRAFRWRDDQPATVAWVEALDGGDPAVTADRRDRLYQLAAPFDGTPRALCSTRNRLRSVTWGAERLAAVTDSWRKDRSVKVYLIDPSRETPAPHPLFDYSSQDLYGQPGSFVTATNGFGREVLLLGRGGRVAYLEGEGHSPEGSRPFLDELDVAKGTTRRLWRADGTSTYETLIRVLDLEKGQLLTRIESPTDYPDIYVRTLGGDRAPRRLTAFPNPFAAFAGVHKEKIHYTRADGVALSGDLYLPAGYDRERDGRLPMLLEAYPIEFKDPDAAGMVRGSPHEFISLSWGSPVFWAARGYAVLDNAQFPIVGAGDAEPNDTYVEQLVANAAAAIKAVTDLGVVDPQRVAVMGHSYGAFMTANLLAHSDLFAAGIARSGAYNRTLTPFGFQAEERTFWEARDVYMKMSPFAHADRIGAPLLLIHGEADNNSGTFTMQSERLFAALKGLGGTARLVLLPFESHGYAARENILHMLWEMDTWLERYVKHAGEAK